jgi:hypothetical protein
MPNNDSSSVSQCPGRLMRGRKVVRVCGEWFNNHPSGLCKACRQPGAVVSKPNPHGGPSLTRNPHGVRRNGQRPVEMT